MLILTKTTNGNAMPLPLQLLMGKNFFNMFRLMLYSRQIQLLIFSNLELKSIHTITSNTRANIESLKLDSYSKQIEDWLSPPDTSTNLNESLQKR
ncbi:hypothetical protein N7488_010095 [Penicillium malachiteum]|nr:hypothetical protein N7488_010095 [Penicillium malachiteum]